MVYKKNFVVSIRANGKILREKEECVYIPFGTEYEIVLKNLGIKKVVVRVGIDGDIVSGENPLILDANETFVLKRSFNRGNQEEGNRFKFVEMTERVEHFRGIKLEDGLVRVDYEFADDVKKVVDTFVQDQIYYRHVHHYHHAPYYIPQPYTPSPIYCANPYSQMAIGSSNIEMNSFSSSVRGGEGFTVPGSRVDQEVMIRDIPQKMSGERDVIILKMVGSIENMKVDKIVDVKTKIECEVCGKKSNARNKFCSDCGASLQII
jgi:hypothetical protein